MNIIDAVVSVALIPLSLPVLFLRECLSAAQDMIGLNVREMEGKVSTESSCAGQSFYNFIAYLSIVCKICVC